MNRRLSKFGTAFAAMVCLFLGNVSLRAATVNWTNTASGNWNAAANWEPNLVPGPSDTAVITNTGVTVSLNGPTTVGGVSLGAFISGTTTLSLNGQTLALNGPLTVYPSGSFTLNGGALVGNTNAVLSGSLGWTAGLLEGVWTLAPGSLLSISGTSLHNMPNCVLTNFGTVAWSGGDIRSGSTVVYNYGLWDAQTDQYFNNGYGGSAVFNNLGTFRKSGGASEFANATFFAGVAFNQLAGMLDVQNGTNGLELALQSGGDFTGGYVTTNQFGLTVLSAGTFNLNGTVTGTNTWQDAGNLTGNNVINGALTWVAGSWVAVPSVTVASNSTLIVTGASNHDLPGCAVTNYGAVFWAGGTIRSGNDGTVYNYGLWDAQSDQAFCLCGYGGGEVFNNLGTFRKSGGASEFANATIFQNVAFNQLAGMLDVQNGTNGLELALQSGGSFTGGFITTNQFGLTVLAAGTFTVNGTVTGTNTWQDAGSLAGDNVIHGALTWVAGPWLAAPSVTIASNSTLIVTGANNHDLPGCAVTNYGAVLWGGGTIRGGNNGTVYNYGLWEAQSDQAFCLCGYSGGAVFNNLGTFRKSGGASEFASATIFQNVAFNQLAGMLDVQNGTNGLELALQGGGSLTGGFITTNSQGLTVLSIGSFTLNGTVTGTNTWQDTGNLVGNNVIHGALTWVGGLWTGAGVTIANDGSVIVAGSANMDLNSAAVTNYGTLVWVSGTIRGGNNTGIYNYGLWNAQCDQSFNDAYGGSLTFNNFGTFRKSAGTGTTFLAPGVLFLQTSGVLEAQSGNLALQGSGSFAGGTLSGSVGGTLSLSAGNFTINGATTAGNVVENAGNLVGTNVINGTLNWAGGIWSGAAVTIGSNSLVTVSGAGNMDMNVTAVTNYGTLSWANGTIRGGNGTVIDNFGLWDAQSDQVMNSAYGGSAVFNNFGTLRKSGGAGEFTGATSFQNVPLNQLAGVLDVENGTNGLQVSLQGGGNFAGGYITTNNQGLTVLAFGSFRLNGTVTGLNTWESGGGLVGTNVIQGGLNWVNGDWNSAPCVTIASNSTLLITGGADHNFNAAILTNSGTVMWSGGNLRGGNGSTIYNYGLWDAQSDQTLNDAYGGTTTFNNRGTFRKSSGVNLTTIDNGITFLNPGSVAALSGTIQFNSSPALAGGLLSFGIGSPTTFGRVTVSSTANLAGGLGAVLLNGYTPSVGAQFAVMSFPSTNGTFNDYSGLNAGGGVAFTPILSSTSVVLSTVATNFTPVAPTIITQPKGLTANYGDTVVLQVTASGSPTLLFQWNKEQLPLSGATNSTLTLSNVTFAEAGAYSVGVTNSAGGVLSQVAQLTVVPVLPGFTSQPQSLTVGAGSNATFRVSVVGEPPPVLSWRFNGTNLVDGGRIGGSSSTNLSIANVRFGDAGNYVAVAANGYGAVTSSVAVLHVGFPDLAPFSITAPTNAALGQTIALVFGITNGANGRADGPWFNQFLLAADTNGTSAYNLGTASFNGSVPAFSSITVTQSLIMPATVFGTRYFEVVVNSTTNLPETTVTNNGGFALAPIFISAADLALEQLTAPASAQYGQNLNISFSVTNIGSAPALAGWSDQIYFNSTSNSLSGATLLATLAGTSPLAPGAGYVRNPTVAIPQTANSVSGTFYLLAVADPGNGQLETNKANNLLSTPITMALPPLPDLVAGQVSSPTNATAGQSIPVAWAVTNVGAATASGPWQETVYLIPAGLTLAQFNTNTAAYPALGVFTLTNDLAAGASVTRTQQVVLPLTGSAGDLRVAVIVNSDHSVLEQDAANDSALGLNDIQVPAALSLTLPVATVGENTPTPNLACLVSRNGAVASAVVVALASSASNHLSVPASLTIPAGAASAPFLASVLDDGAPGPDALVSVSASANGYLSSTAQVTVVNTDLPFLSLSLASSVVTEGQTVLATVTNWPASSQPVVVTLTSSSAGALTSPNTVTIPAGSNSVTFTVLAVQNTLIAPPQTYTFNASANGYAPATASLTVLNNNAPMLTLSLNNTNINETDGPFAAVGTVSRLPVTDQPVLITLSSTNPGAATVPAQVAIPSLQASVQFYVAAVNNPSVTGPSVTLLSAQALDNAGNPVGTPATQTLVVEDANGPTLKLSLASKVVGKGLNPATTATVSVTLPPTNALVVTLTSSDKTEATVPASVTLLAGQTNASFNVVSLNDGLPGTTHPVTITASASNYANGHDALTVTDLGLPDLVVSSITVPSTATTATPMTIGFRLFNQGLGRLTNGVNQNVYLTQGPASGNYLPVGTAYFQGPLAAGQYVDQSLVVPGNALPPPGTYSVVVIADANNTAAELNEANNNAVSQSPVVISPEYTATVHAGVTTVLSGTSVPLTGSATLMVGGPATNKAVNILIVVRGLQRVLGVLTDAAGNFSTVFTPLPNEAGSYTVAAVFPGVTSAPAQDQFNILGMSATPTALGLNVTEGSAGGGSVSLQNLGAVPLSGLLASVNGLAANLRATAAVSTNYLAGQSAVVLSVNVTAVDSSLRQSAFTVQVTSSEGAVLDVPVNVSVNALTANLFVPVSPLKASMLRGAQTILQFDVINTGGAPSGPLSINLPAVSWLSVASTNPLPSIAPGATNQVTLLLSPDANLALGPYAGSLSVVGSDVGLQVPFTFTAVSDAHGALTVHSVDEYTYFASGSPPLTNATVTLLDPFTKAVVASGITDTNGVFATSGVMEGVYELDLSADQHVPFRGEAIISAGQSNSITAFLSRQTVTYIWTVVPTSIQDTNHITIQATFETDVPAPVVVPEPAAIDLAPLTQPGQFMDIPFTLANYGLIAVQNVKINISQHPLYRFDLLTTDVGDLPAHGTVTIPMRITRLSDSGQTQAPAGGNSRLAGEPCNIQFGLNYSYPCGPFGIEENVQVTVLHVSGDCSTTPGYSGCSVSCVNCGGGDSGYGFIYNPNNPGSGGLTVKTPPSFSLPPSCDPCWDAARDCIIGFIPVVGCVYSAYQGCLNRDTRSVENCTFAAIGCVGGDLGNVAACLQTVLRCICPESANCWSNFVYSAYANNSLSSLSASVGSGFSNNDLRDVYWARSYAGVALLGMTLGDTDGRWFSPGSGGAFSTWYNGFTAAIQSGSTGGVYISPTEAANLLALPVPNTISNADVIAAINRWNLTLTNWDAGILSPTNALAGSNTNFIDYHAYTNLVAVVLQQYQISQAAGYASPVAGMIAAMQNSGKQAGSVCARVVLQIDQDAVLTRDAFRATLQLNNSSADPLSNLSVNLVVQNTSGQDVTSLFGIELPSVSGGLTGVNGAGSLAPGASGSAVWTLIPSLDAAPQAPTNYLVSGTFSYVQNGATVTIPLSPAPISVQPNPQLYLKYFLQRDVFADDPFTPAIEPSVPFPLAVMVQNKGYGVARNFQITSAQPTIVDNEKGLLINFKIIGTQVAGQPETPSLTASFGDIPAQSNRIGEWLFLSSLQGLFIDYEAKFEHIDPLGNPRLSLIQGVEIHQMVHLVEAAGAWEDGLPDFLTAETPNYLSLPDTLYLSDGTIQPVSVVQTGSTDGPASPNHLQVQFTANFPAGFSYVVVPDPANGQLALVGVQNSNGTNLLSANFYVTDRTFIGLGQRPLDENMLHLFDYHTNAGSYTYTLAYQPPPAVSYTNAPVSSVFSLPAQSPPSFGVAWSGAPYVGQAPLAFYDIYSSDNGGPYTLWQGHTTATGAFFSGTNGHTYAFYSIATDTVGNREAIPLQAQAQTTVNATNYLPTIAVASNVTVNAGQTLSLSVTAGDPNPFANLTFSLGAGAPAGMTIDPVTGHVTWPTSPSFGGTTNVIRIIVADNNQPPLTATGTVSVAVIQVISPPALAPIGNYTINEGTLLSFTAVATESNLPPRSLHFSLGAGAPTNAVINSTSGLFQWRPTPAQAPSTNLITIVVTDDGVPPLSASQAFTVVVQAVNFEFLLSLGSTNVLAGGTVSVPVGLQSSLPLTNITALLELPKPGLSNLILQAVSPEIISTLLQPVGTNQYALQLTLNPASSPGTSRTLAQLGFAAEPRAHSAIIPLTLPSLSGFEADGSPAPKPGTGAGAVFVIASEPLLNAWLGPDSHRELTLFGNPGTAYEVDYRTNLQAGSWQFGWRVPMTNTFAVFDANATLPQVFYRAESFAADPPILEMNSSTPGHLVLLLYGRSGTNYAITTGTNLLNSTNWPPLAGFVLTNSFQFIDAGGTTDQMRFFRAKRP